MKPLKTVLLGTIASVVLAACTVAKDDKTTKSASSSELTQNQTMLASQKFTGVWIDVRSSQEFAEGHLQEAKNIPVEEIEARIGGISPDKNAPINLYCRSGRRAQVALETLQKMGYTHVTNHGGYEDLKKQGLR